MSNKTLQNFNINELMTKWQELQNIPNIFSYRLNVRENKYLKGNNRFYAELNPDRTNLRRAPQSIHSMNPHFDEKKFNFNKINPQECMMTITYEEDEDITNISLIINKSPMTLYHTLICPNVEMGMGQKITLEALRFCVDLLLSAELNQNFRIGYNSPGALASVNHLHLHLMYIEKDLYIDHVKLSFHAQSDIYRLADDMPTNAICFLFNHEEDLDMRQRKLINLHQFLMWLCDNDMPHNIFMTPDRSISNAAERCLKVFVFARKEFCIIKDPNKLNVGFCELAGYVPLGNKDLYDNLTENDVLMKINQETGDIFKNIYDYFK